MEEGLDNYDLSQCTELCASRPEDCKTYQHSSGRQKCKIFNDDTPANNTNYQDFVSCTIGTQSFYHTWDSIGNIYYDFKKSLSFKETIFQN